VAPVHACARRRAAVTSTGTVRRGRLCAVTVPAWHQRTLARLRVFSFPERTWLIPVRGTSYGPDMVTKRPRPRGPRPARGGDGGRGVTPDGRVQHPQTRGGHQ